MNTINRVIIESESECGYSGSIQECERNKKCEKCGGSSFYEHGERKRFCKMCNIRLCLVVLQHNNLKRILTNPVVFNPTRPVKYLGCNSIYFKEYIKSKMIDCIDWNNVHLDHIKPVNAFNLDDEDEFLDCCHYTNFQPITEIYNTIKGDRWSETDEIFWNANIKRTEYLSLYLPV